MGKKKDPMFWMGHPVDDEEHARSLHMKAAMYEFHDGIPRQKAEQRVIEEDKRERHEKAAAHHLEGMRSAHTIGATEDAQRHHDFYSLHMKVLGHDPGAAVPHEVARHRGGDDWKHAYSFKSHKDDQFLVQPVKKAEGDEPPKLGRNPLEPEMPQTDEQFGSGLHRRLLATLQNKPGARGKLLSYLKPFGIEEPDLPAVLTNIQEPLKTIPGGGKTSAPKYGHLRVVKAEDLAFLANLPSLAKGPHDKVKQFDVRRTFLRSRHTPEEKAWDYSAWLSPEHQQNGYRMFVLSHGPNNPVRVHVIQTKPGTRYQQKVGMAHGNVQDGDLEVERYNLAGAGHPDDLHGHMLNAMMGHAKRYMGAGSLSHAAFTPEASAFIEAVAKPHGLELGDVEDVDEPQSPKDYGKGAVKANRPAAPKRLGPYVGLGEE